MSRYRRKAGQILIELLYGEGTHIDRKLGIVINISKMAQALHIRPIRLIESLEWLYTAGLLKSLLVGRYEAQIETIEPKQISTTTTTTTESKWW